MEALAFTAAITIGITLAAAVMELSNISVYGWYLKEEELDAYLGKYLEGAHLNPFSNRMITGMPNYVAKRWGPLSTWYVEDYGLVPRWSKWTKRLDAKRAELRVPPTKLSDL
jgi:hypothetical protein